MSNKELADKLHARLLLWSGPLNHTHVAKMIEDYIGDARAVGFKEAKFAAIEAVRKKGLAAAQFDDGLQRAQMGLEIIDALLPLAPAATTDKP